MPIVVQRAQSARSAGTELNLTPWSDRALAPLLHLGLLHSTAPQYSGPRRVWDARVDVAHSIGLMTLQLSWGTASRARTAAGGDSD